MSKLVNRAFRLNNKVAIITGGAYGIGRSFCLGLADEGAKIVIADIDLEAAKATAAEIEAKGTDAIALKTDVSSLEETREIIGFWGRYVMDKEFFDPAGWEAQNMLTAALLVIASALRRTETRGVHYREDFPETDPAWARHQTLLRTAEQLILK